MEANNLSLMDFRRMRKETHGMMPAETYLALYSLAKDEIVDNVIDVGVGRGMTTIAYALGLLCKNHGGRVVAIDQFFQVRVGPHPYSKSSHPENCVDLNVNEFKDNLERYEVSPLVDYYVGSTSDVHADLPKELTFGLLSIDVDGHIDRELGYFYDRVKTGGYIVIDDYADIVDKRGRERIERMRGDGESSIREKIQLMEQSRSRLLLGKHLLTKRLADYFVEIGMLERVEVYGKTAVFRKASSRQFSSFDLAGVNAIESDLIESFVAAAKNV